MMGLSAAIPFGAWPSPISSAAIAGARFRLSYPTARNGHVWWQETVPAEAGRTTIVHRTPDELQRSLLPPPWSAQTRVHEYGGCSYLPVRTAVPGVGWAVVF